MRITLDSTDSIDEYTLDLEKFNHLDSLFSRTQFNFRNAEKCTSLRELVVQEWYTPDLEYLVNAPITKLTISSGKLVSLKGIDKLYNLYSLSLSNQRLLKDVSDIKNCLQLIQLEIEACNKLALENIPALPKLYKLTLVGRQTIENCNFFQRFPMLKQLILGVKIADGNLKMLLRLEHCVILSDYRHYTHKNSDLPKKQVL